VCDVLISAGELESELEHMEPHDLAGAGVGVILFFSSGAGAGSGALEKIRMEPELS